MSSPSHRTRSQAAEAAGQAVIEAKRKVSSAASGSPKKIPSSITAAEDKSPSSFTFDYLTRVLLPPSEQAPCSHGEWRHIIDAEEKLVVFFQLNYLAPLPRVSRCVRILHERNALMEWQLKPTAFVGRQAIGPGMIAALLGGRDFLASSEDLTRLLEHVAALPEEVMQHVKAVNLDVEDKEVRDDEEVRDEEVPRKRAKKKTWSSAAARGFHQLVQLTTGLPPPATVHGDGDVREEQDRREGKEAARHIESGNDEEDTTESEQQLDPPDKDVEEDESPPPKLEVGAVYHSWKAFSAAFQDYLRENHLSYASECGSLIPKDHPLAKRLHYRYRNYVCSHHPATGEKKPRARNGEGKKKRPKNRLGNPGDCHAKIHFAARKTKACLEVIRLDPLEAHNHERRPCFASVPITTLPELHESDYTYATPPSGAKQDSSFFRLNPEKVEKIALIPSTMVARNPYTFQIPGPHKQPVHQDFPHIVADSELDSVDASFIAGEFNTNRYLWYVMSRMLGGRLGVERLRRERDMVMPEQLNNRRVLGSYELILGSDFFKAIDARLHLALAQKAQSIFGYGVVYSLDQLSVGKIPPSLPSFLYRHMKTIKLSHKAIPAAADAEVSDVEPEEEE